MLTIDTKRARRLALARTGLLASKWTGLPARAPKNEAGARDAAYAVMRRFGYLQLDTVSIAGARSHVIVLLSRLRGFDPSLGEALLTPGEPVFEYWGHEACWLPLELYPHFAFRRERLGVHPWWGDLLTQHPDVAKRLRAQLRSEGPLRSADMEGQGGAGWWNLKLAKKIATAMWMSGELAIRERVNFLRTYDLTERVVPAKVLDKKVSREEALETLMLLAVSGQGWTSRRTIQETWRLRNMKKEIDAALDRLVDRGALVRCALHEPRRHGFVRPEDLELADRLVRLRPREDRGVLLSPFDPLLWDRQRVMDLFGFEQVLEIFKPAPQRKYGYYCLPVLAGERLVARVDLRADRKQGRLHVLVCHHESPKNEAATATALERYADAVELAI